MPLRTVPIPKTGRGNVFPLFAVLGAVGIVLGAAYLLWMLQRVIFGTLPEEYSSLTDLTLLEVACLGVAGGQGTQNMGFFAVRQFDGSLAQLHGSLSVANFIFGACCEYPRQVV
mgnify:CR=1 FL=1